MTARKSPCPPWEPNYRITPPMAERLMRLEAIRVELEHVVIPPAVEVELRRRARLRSTHYSTRIEGNRLTLAETGQAVDVPSAPSSPAFPAGPFPGRERDVREVQHYWDALLRIEEWAASDKPITEEAVQRLHAIVERGARAKPTPYRDSQNVIRDSASGAIVYLPPEPADVPKLMAGWAAWLRTDGREPVPAPLVAGLTHYQFVTIHPYLDGNGRTARLLTTWLLQQHGYGLKGALSLEEEHARDLPAYYQALAVHPHHNYYFGRAEADLTPWLDYFVTTLLRAFERARGLVEEVRLRDGSADTAPAALHPPTDLDVRQRMVWSHLMAKKRVTAVEVARILGLSDRMARVLLARWVADGWLQPTHSSRKLRAYALPNKHLPD